MSAPMTSIIDNILQKRKATATEPKRIKKKLESLISKINDLEKMQRELSANAQTNFSIKDQLKAINLNKLLTRITQEQELWENIYQRFVRETINIGVAGSSGQGKSTFLQTVSGLTDEIPSKAGMPCTSVQSNIFHSNTRNDADVYFYSRSAFFQEIICPYYQELGLKPPASLDEFGRKPLHPKPTNHPKQPTIDSIYERLQEYRNHFQDYAPLLETTERIETISRDKIKEYVSQEYNAQHQRINFNHYAVRQVDIHCKFPNTDVEKICLIDTIGLGDTRLGDEERLIKALAQDVDFILFIRFPEAQRFMWDKRDIELCTVAFQALRHKLLLDKWSLMLLNHSGSNTIQCEGLKNTVGELKNIKWCLMANCKDRNEANGVLQEILNYLTKNIDSLDRQYMEASYESLRELQGEVHDELAKAFIVLEQYGDGNAEYAKLRSKFMKNLYNTIENLRQEFRDKPQQADPDYQAQVDIAITKCNTHTGIPSEEELESLKNRRGSYAAAYAETIHQMRPNLLKHFHPLEAGLKFSLEKTKTEVSEALIKLGLAGITPTKGTEFLTILSEKIPASSVSLKLGFEFISSFQFLYKTQIQSIIWRKISEYLPSDPSKMPQSPSDSGKTSQPSPESNTSNITENSSVEATHTIITDLKERHQKAVEACKIYLENLAKSLSTVRVSMIEEFADHITRAEGIEQEWDIFLGKYRSEIWGELKDLDQQAEVTRVWLKLVEETTNINRELKS